VVFLIFASDNWAGAHPAIAASLSTAAGAYHAPYGGSDVDDRAAAALSALFERDVAVFFVATGTAANSLALASVARPASVMFCHSEAHVIHHEGGAVELQTGGGKLVPVGGAPGGHGKIDPDALRLAMTLFPDDDVHVGEKTALSLTQATEAGTVYSLEEIRALSAIAAAAGLKTHMDGARFSNAVAALGCTPAEMTWKAGVDILSLGGTKNGCWCAEAVIFFNPADARAMPRLRKRGANLFSKSAFVAAQFEAWLQDGLWLDLARHANAMARKLTEAAQMSAQTRIAWPTQGNQIFLIMTDEKAEALRQAGARFYDWETPRGMEGELASNEKIRRFIGSFATREEDVAAIAALL
jgi:threonine aldolase